MKTHIILLSVLLATISHHCYSQKTSDVSGWAIADFTLVHNKWDYTGSLEYRSKDNIGMTDLFSIGQYGRYTFSPYFKLSLGYEIFFNNKAGSTVIDHRLLLQNESAFKLYRFKIDNRLSLLNDFEKLSKPGWGVRDRIRVKYPISQFEPFAYVELYYRFKSEKVMHHKNRYGVGMNYLMTSRNTFGVYYMMEKYYQKTFVNNVFGITYALTVAI